MKDIFSKNGVSLERLMSLDRVVRAGCIRNAARGDANVQTLLSRQIGELEKALGLSLLDRTRKPYPPTDSARRLAVACARFVQDVENVAEETGGLKRPITVGAGEVVIRHLFIPKIGRRRKGVEQVRWVMRNLQRGKIQEGLAAEWLDVGIASGLEAGGAVEVAELESYGFRLLLPNGDLPDRSGWKRLADLPVVLPDGDAGLRRYVTDSARERGVEISVGGECTSFPQAVDLADAAGWAVFVPEYWWKREKTWATRTQKLPGLDDYRRVFQLGWNRQVVVRRPEVATLVKLLVGR